MRRGIGYAVLVLGMAASFAIDTRFQSLVQDARRPQAEPVFRTLTDMGKPLTVVSTLLAIAIFDPKGPALARVALAALIPANLAVEGLKRATYRARPDGEHKRSNASFPSSHAGNAFCLAWLLARRYRRWAWIPLGVAALVAFSRIYLNRHYLSDAIGGALVGMLAAWATAWWLERRRTQGGRASRQAEGKVP